MPLIPLLGYFWEIVKVIDCRCFGNQKANDKMWRMILRVPAVSPYNLSHLWISSKPGQLCVELSWVYHRSKPLLNHVNFDVRSWVALLFSTFVMHVWCLCFCGVRLFLFWLVFISSFISSLMIFFFFVIWKVIQWFSCLMMWWII